MKKILNKPIYLSFILSLLLGSFIVIPNIIAGSGIYHLIADFDYQLIPFNQLMNDSIKDGNFLYTWYNDLGSNFLGTYSFYNLFSPFTLIAFIFPSSWYPYLIGPITILKYGVAGLCSYLYIGRYCKNKNYAVIGSLLYAFSGYQLTNILFCQFHDIVALFPLLLYSFDKLVIDKKRGLFCLIVLLMALTNWFFFIEEGIFLFIYFIVKVIKKDFIINKRLLFTIIIEGFIGIMMASFVLLPTLFFIKSNPRMGYNWTFIEALKYPVLNYFEIIRAFLFAPEVMANRSIFDVANYGSVELFLPVVGILYVISYIINKPKDSFSIILYVLLIFMFIPILNSSFVLFNTHYYARWFFMPILVMCLMTSCAMDNNYNIKYGVILSIISILLFLIILFFYSRFKYLFIGNSIYPIIILIITILCIFISTFIYYKCNKQYIVFNIISIFVFVTIIGNYMIYQYKDGHFIDKSYSNYLIKYPELNDYVDLRSNSISCPPNISAVQRINNINSFNSNISGKAFEFYNSIGINRETSTIITNKDIISILGVDTIIYCGNDDLSDYRFVKNIDNYSIYKNDNALSIGFLPENYISKEEFFSNDYSTRINILKDTVVLDDNQLMNYKDLIYKNDLIVNDFKYLKNGFSIDLETSNTGFYVIQIPYDEGWYAYNNDKSIKVEDVDNGLIGIKVNAGINKIVFRYKVPKLLLGIIISLIGLISFFIYLFLMCKSTIFK